jgi:hypothetical protein
MEHLFLLEGMLCRDCFDNRPKDAKPKRTPRSPRDKKAYNKTYRQRNAARIKPYDKERKRKKNGTALGRFVIRCGFQYVQPDNHPKFGARSTAKVYSSLAYARQGAARIEGAVIENGKVNP